MYSLDIQESIPGKIVYLGEDNKIRYTLSNTPKGINVTASFNDKILWNGTYSATKNCLESIIINVDPYTQSHLDNIRDMKLKGKPIASVVIDASIVAEFFGEDLFEVPERFTKFYKPGIYNLNPNLNTLISRFYAWANMRFSDEPISKNSVSTLAKKLSLRLEFGLYARENNSFMHILENEWEILNDPKDTFSFFRRYAEIALPIIAKDAANLIFEPNPMLIVDNISEDGFEIGGNPKEFGLTFSHLESVHEFEHVGSNLYMDGISYVKSRTQYKIKLPLKIDVIDLQKDVSNQKILAANKLDLRTEHVLIQTGL